MRNYRYSTYFTVFLISLFSTLFASYVQPSDVPEVMGQLFTYHIDQKEMTAPLMERSISLYIQNFDSDYSYLAKSEVKPYLEANEQTYLKIVGKYKNKNYETFFALNKVFTDAISRARGWRAAWSKDPESLIASAPFGRGGKAEK